MSRATAAHLDSDDDDMKRGIKRRGVKMRIVHLTRGNLSNNLFSDFIVYEEL